jgi:DNA-binding GntR family transcriptional regulator
VFSEQASKYIGELLKEGRYNPSEVISECDLSEELGMSRTPVRTALYRLEEAGLIEKLAGRGWRVRPLTKADVEEIFQLKITLEVLCVKLAAERITPVESDHLIDLTNQMEAAIESKNLTLWLKCDSDFHSHIMGVGGNQRLQNFVNTLNDQWYRLRPAYMSVTGRAYDSIHEHRVISEAIVAHDVEAACTAAVKHMEEVHYAVQSAMDNILHLVGGSTL